VIDRGQEKHETGRLLRPEPEIWHLQELENADESKFSLQIDATTRLPESTSVGFEMKTTPN